jgi:signal transduction histidine kinase/CheY-like chemotaxis protein
LAGGLEAKATPGGQPHSPYFQFRLFPFSPSSEHPSPKSKNLKNPSMPASSALDHQFHHSVHNSTQMYAIETPEGPGIKHTIDNSSLQANSLEQMSKQELILIIQQLSSKEPVDAVPGTERRHSQPTADMAELTTTLQRSKDTERFLRTLLDLAPVTLFTHREDTDTTDWVSPHVTELLDLPSTFNDKGEFQLGHFDWMDYIHPDDMVKHGSAREVYPKPGEIHEALRRLIRHDGQVRWIVSRETRFDRADGTTGILGAVVDVTEIEQAKKKMELALKVREEIVANVSHEMRTPLNGIQGNCYLLMHDKSLGGLTPQQLEVIREMKDCSDSLGTIVDDLLTLSKVEAGKTELKDESFDLLTSIEKHLKVFVRRAQEGGKELTIKWQPKLQTRLRDTLCVADLTRLRQCLSNLLSNAIKFTPVGGEISLTVDMVEMENANSPDLMHPNETYETLSWVVSSIPPVLSPNIISQLRNDPSYFNYKRASGSPRKSRGCLTQTAGRDSYFPTFKTSPMDSFGSVIQLPIITLEFKVVDSGIGIAPDQLPRLFHAFTQVHDELPPLMHSSDSCNSMENKRRSPKYGGTGLGLAITRKLALLMGGNVTASSLGKGLGSTFDLSIPVKLIDPGVHVRIKRADVSPMLELEERVVALSWPVARAQSDSEEDNPQTPKKQIRVLAVEDNPINVKVLVRFLAILGYACCGGDGIPETRIEGKPTRGTVQVAIDGQEAIEAYAKSVEDGLPFDVVLMGTCFLEPKANANVDLQLPKVDGFTAAEEIFQVAQKNQLPNPGVVALSATCLDSDQERCSAVGMRGFLSKPLKMSELRQTLEFLE